MNAPTKLARPDRRWPGDDRSIPAWVYSDPDVFEREMETFFFGPAWSYVGMECELPAPNTWKRAVLGPKSLILTRDESDEIHVLENRCSHRGAPICWTQRGEGAGLNCPYHQWRFTLDGELTGVPFEAGVRGAGGMPEDFDKAAHGLRRLRVARRGGAIWASAAEDGPDFETYVGPGILEALARVESKGKPRLLGASRQVFQANWKMWMENARDNYHATLLHTFLIAFRLVRADLPPPRNAFDRGHSVNRNFTRPQEDPDESKKAMREISATKSMSSLNDMETVATSVLDYEDGVNIGFQMFPCTMFQPHLNVPSYRQIVPLDVGTHEVHWTFFGFEGDDEEMTGRRLKQANMFGPAGFVTAEDGEVLVKSQPNMRTASDAEQIVAMGLRTPERTETLITEAAIRDFYKHYRVAMGFAEA